MLNKEELEKISTLTRLSLKNTEKDYLLELLLFLIYSFTGRALIFKGGTALYKLHGLNRFSEDLDFTSSSKLKVEELFKKIQRKLENIEINARIKEVNDNHNQKNIKLELKCPLFDSNPRNLSILTINISMKEQVIYEPQHETLFTHYRDIPSFDIFVMPINEMLAEKIRALITRDKARDVYDVWFLIKKGVKPSIKDINKKLRLYNQRYIYTKLVEKIEEKRKAWEMDLRGLIIGTLPEFTKIKNEILAGFKEVD